MKIKGTFTIRNVVGDIVIIPVGQTTLDFNGTIIVNEIGSLIWKLIYDGKNKQEIIQSIRDQYDVNLSDATADLDEFLTILKNNNLLEE